MDLENIATKGQNFLEEHAGANFDGFDPADYTESAFKFITDPKVRETLEEFTSEPEGKARGYIFAAFVLEEDYEAASKLVDREPEYLEARFSRQAGQLRRKRNEYGLAKPHGTENSMSGRNRAQLEAVNDLYEFAVGESDDLYLNEFLPTADRALE